MKRISLFLLCVIALLSGSCTDEHISSSSNATSCEGGVELCSDADLEALRPWSLFKIWADVVHGIITNNACRFGKHKPTIKKIIRLGQLGVAPNALYEGARCIESIMIKIEHGRPENITTAEMKYALSFHRHIRSARSVVKARLDSYVAPKIEDPIEGIIYPEMRAEIKQKIVDAFAETPEGNAELKAQKLYNDDGSIDYDQAYTYLRRSKKVSNRDVVSAINSEGDLIDGGKAAAKQESKNTLNNVGL